MPLEAIKYKAFFFQLQCLSLCHAGFKLFNSCSLRHKDSTRADPCRHLGFGSGHAQATHHLQAPSATSPQAKCPAQATVGKADQTTGPVPRGWPSQPAWGRQAAPGRSQVEGGKVSLEYQAKVGGSSRGWGCNSPPFKTTCPLKAEGLLTRGLSVSPRRILC